MTNQQFGEWVKEEMKKADFLWVDFEQDEVIRIAHAIRKKVLQEAIEVLPEERHTPHTAVHSDLRGHHIGYNECLQKVKSSLLNLLTKE